MTDDDLARVRALDDLRQLASALAAANAKLARARTLIDAILSIENRDTPASEAAWATASSIRAALDLALEDKP